jgi:hypothetical protein
MVSGWAAGDYDEHNGRFLVRDSHRHGWTQAYFPGFGWTDVEVTPGYTPPVRERQFSVLPANIFSAGSVGSAEESPDFIQDQADIERLAREAREFAFSQLQLEQRREFPWWTVWTAGSIAATLIVGYALWWLSLRGLKPGGRAYSKLARAGWVLGFRRADNQSPSEFAATFARVSPSAMEAAAKICGAYVIETYARPGTSSGERRELESAWRRCVLSMFAFRVRQLVGMSPEIGEARSRA